MKAYTFNEHEMEVIRDSLVEEYVRLREHMNSQSDPSPRIRKIVGTLEALKKQFQEDCSK